MGIQTLLVKLFTLCISHLNISFVDHLKFYTVKVKEPPLIGLKFILISTLPESLLVLPWPDCPSHSNACSSLKGTVKDLFKF